MKKLFFAVFAALFALCSCQMDELAGHVEEDVLYVKIEDSSVTKTYMGAGNKVLWSDGDQIVAFMKSYEAAKYQVSGESVGNSSAVFTKVSGSGSSGNSAPQHNVAFYPYSFVSSLSKSGSNYVADVTIPSVQAYKAESFDDGFFPMAAVSKDNTLSFRNICGAVNLRLTGSQKVKSVSLSGNSGEKISGAGSVTVYPDNSAPYLKLKSSASSSVTLDCGDGVQLNESQATSFVIVLPPVEFSKGFTMTVTDSEGTEYEIRTEKSNSISRSNIHAVPVLKLGDDFGGDTDAPEYIDENGVNHGPGVEIDGVVWAPVNCGYHETDYPWGKLYQWGRKYGQGYSGAVYDANSVYMGSYSDATVPTLRYGPVPLSEGQLQSYENYFYWTASAPNDWLALPDDNLWNSGTEDNPVKTEYDPCPDGWRVPTYSELNNLKSNRSSWTSNSDNQPGYWFSGSNSYSSLTPSIFLPAAIYRYYRDGQADNRGIGGYYWSSAPKDINASFLCFLSSGMSMSTHRRACGFSVRCVEDKSELIPVSSVSISKSSLTMDIGETQTLSATISPSDANHKTAYWWSEDEAVATVDKTGKVTAVSSGVTTITAMAGMKQATCTVTVNAPVSNQKEYIDENGVNHGPGVDIDGVVWAPVNCGYHKTDFKYGKLYQWGRKYGQGYSGDIYDINGNKVGTYSDVSVPSIESGPVSLGKGQSKDNSNVFYTSDDSPYDWLFSTDYNLWNTGTESIPVKTEYDPCPEGWRVPTYAELSKLSSNRSSLTIDENGHIGRWLSGSSPYSSNSPIVFFSAAGNRAFSGGSAYLRCYGGNYWTSGLYNSHSYCLDIYGSKGGIYGGNRATGYSVRCVQDEGELISVSSVSINKPSLTMEIGETQTLSATISPSNANHKTAYWWSEDETIATVDKTGKVIAVSSGVTTITAMAGMKQATCTVTVNAPVSNQKEYIDENGVNHGPGIEIDGVVWAPVNCGYHKTDFKYGKLYQWGRKYGQGYSGGNYDINGNNVGTYSDASVPSIKSGPVSLGTGQSKSNSNVFYTSDSDHHYDWLSPQNEYLWNAGTESNPLKTEYDPCPEGWRVPTYSELENLIDHYSSWTTDENGQVGYWFSGSSSYSSNSPRVFFPAEGCLGDRNGNSSSRGLRGYYWSSMFSSCEAGCIRLYNDELFTSLYSCATGFSVRCVEDEAELISVSSVSINKSSLTMEIGETQTLSATISPSNANHKTAYWWSEDETVATVDKTGKVTAVSSGVTTITAMAGMKQATCTVTVNAPTSNQKEYIDENGVNHGPGIEIDGVVWAPVNCGYHKTDFKYGKLYQWGRKDGQGYSDEDETSAVIMSGPVSLYTGQLKTNEAKFYKNDTAPYDWLSSSESNLWNLGTEGKPIKTEYDPCPEGWRVPTYSELETLSVHSSWGQNEDGQNGLWFSGLTTSQDAGSKVFFSAAGGIYYTAGSSRYRDSDGSYWSSRPYGELSYELRVCNNPKNVGMGGYYRATGYSVRCVQDEEELIPVSSVSINKSSLTMEIGETQTLSATISPSNANHKTACWWSEDETVATVDKNGKVTAVSSGVTTITAMAGMKQATCKVTVNAPVSNMIDYIDEYGVNHGRGVEIDGVVWAPVNCGYHKTDFKYGKLYQWGRKYGQGYSGSIYDINGNYVEKYSDGTVPSIKSGPVSLGTGQSKSNSNVFYTSENYPYDWVSPQDGGLWNAGTESNPVKTEYDPCPEGWRVPTYAELDNLNNHYSSWTTDENGQIGCWFSGSSSYSSNSPRIFLPAAGYRIYSSGGAINRGFDGNYWSSRQDSGNSYTLYFRSGLVNMYYYGYRAYGHSVRCVQE